MNIELTDDEIREEAKARERYDKNYQHGFFAGAKWAQEQTWPQLATVEYENCIGPMTIAITKRTFEKLMIK